MNIIKMHHNASTMDIFKDYFKKQKYILNCSQNNEICV